jgi:hypothetical protein
MATEDIGPVAMELFERVEGDAMSRGFGSVAHPASREVLMSSSRILVVI